MSDCSLGPGEEHQLISLVLHTFGRSCKPPSVLPKLCLDALSVSLGLTKVSRITQTFAQLSIGHLWP